MKNLGTKKIVKIGNSCYCLLDKYVLFASNIWEKDTVQIECEENKIVITKKDIKNNKEG